MNIPLNIDWQQILLHLLNFVILAGGLYLLLYKPVKTFMEKRQQYYQEQDAKAAKTLADAEKTAAEVRQQLNIADADAAAQLAAAQREHDKLLSDAQKELKDLAVTATEKLVLQSDGDAFDQFLDAAERGKSHA